MAEEIKEFEIQEDANEDKEGRLEELLEKHWEIKESGRKSFTREEIAEKDQLKFLLYDEKEMTDSEMADFLDLEPCTILHFRRKYALPSNSPRNRKVSINERKHNYPTTKKERKLIQKFMVAFLREVDEDKYTRTGYNIKGMKIKTDN